MSLKLRRSGRIIFPLCFVIIVFSIPFQGFSQEAELKGARQTVTSLLEALEDTGQKKKETKEEVLRSQLLNDVKIFKEKRNTISDRQAAEQWLALVRRYWQIGPPEQDDSQRYAQYTYSNENSLNFLTLLKAIPGPEAWDDLREIIDDTDLKTSPPSFAKSVLKCIVFYINSDLEGVQNELNTMSALSDTLDEYKKQAVSQSLTELNTFVAKARLSDSKKTVRDNFSRMLQAKSQSAAQLNEIKVPNLFSLLPEEEAVALIEKIFQVPNVVIEVPGAGKTLEYIKSILSEKITSLDQPQWHLITDPDDVAVFEAMNKRFTKQDKSGQKQSYVDTFTSQEQNLFEQKNDSLEAAKRKAEMIYIVGLLTENRIKEAVDVTLEMEPGQFSQYNFKRALRTVNQARLARRIYTYCSEVLKKTSSFELWEQFRNAAVSLGEIDAVIAIIDTHLAREDIDTITHLKLLSERVSASLAVGRVEDALADLHKGISFERTNILPSSSEKYIDTQEDFSRKLIQLGKLLERPELTNEGIDGLVKIYTDYSAIQGVDTSFTLPSVLRKACKEMIKAGRYAEAERFLAKEIQKKLQAVRGRELEVALGGASPVLDELVLLLTLYSEAGRIDDVFYLLDNFPWWGEKDILEIEDEQVQLVVARALQQTGRNRDAENIIKAHLLENGDNDDFYRLLVATTGSAAIPWLYQIYERDKFEERPLIWIAYLLKEQGKFTEAEKVIRQALKVDPTDGEQKSGDRVFGYTVLADTLELLGKKEDAQFFADVVRAVRIAEQGDLYEKAGMLKESLAKYGEAQGLFADAYCVQWRMAERLYELGKFEEAKQHYEIAFERMPEQFGQVASFCFGCENVFDKKSSRSIAESVLLRLEKTTPERPQVYYLLGQLRESQLLFSEAYSYYSKAVELDTGYLDAWKKIVRLMDKLYHTQAQKDEVSLKIMAMDPVMNHYSPNFQYFVNMEGLWQALQNNQKFVLEKPDGVYTLQASTRLINKYEEKARELFAERFKLRSEYEQSLKQKLYPADALSKHYLVEQLTETAFWAEGFY